MFLTERNTSRQDIDCPGDTISYNCTILTNSETPHLTWRVTLPGHMPLNITYDNFSNQDSFNLFGMNIIVVLREFRYEYIESVIVLIVVDDVVLNGTKLECGISPYLNIATASVYVNTSGQCALNKILSNNRISVFSTSNSNWIQPHNNLS